MWNIHTKIKLLIFLLLGTGLIATAQIEKQSILKGKCLASFDYECTQKLDTLGDSVERDTLTLRIGEHLSQSYTRSQFFVDSLVFAENGGDKLQKLMLESILSNTRIPGPKFLQGYIYKDYLKNELETYVEKRENYSFREPGIKWKWHLTDSVKNMKGYSCRKATCSFRGRDYVAWFSEEIPYREGPWKFGGLPGLIVEVYDTKMHYHFKLIGENTVLRGPIYFYRTMTNPPKVVSRLWYLKRERRVYDEVKEIKSRTGKPHAFDLLERDYK